MSALPEDTQYTRMVWRGAPVKKPALPNIVNLTTQLSNYSTNPLQCSRSWRQQMAMNRRQEESLCGIAASLSHVPASARSQSCSFAGSLAQEGK